MNYVNSEIVQNYYYAHAAVNCQDPGFVQTSSRQLTGVDVGDKAIYSCDPGHLLTSGDLERVCLDSGEWNGTVPICSGTFGLQIHEFI